MLGHIIAHLLAQRIPAASSQNRCHFATRDVARTEVFGYIEVWYNRKRRHSSRGYVSPAEFERPAPTDYNKPSEKFPCLTQP